MYPILENCLVRGSQEEFYLQNYKTGEEFQLEEIHAKILIQCTGKNSVEWISKKFAIAKEEIIDFLNVLIEADIISLNNGIAEKFKHPAISKYPYLREVQIDATGKCNLFGKCKHCYGKESFQKAAKNELRINDFREIFRQMEELNVARCFLSGGEIFLRKDLPEIIHICAENKVHLAGIFTNGTLFKQDVFNALKQTGMNTVFLVSLDSHIEDINNFMRGADSFKKTLSFIKMVKEIGFPVTINTMVIKQNVNHLTEMYSFLEDLQINRWRISIPREQGEAIFNKELIIPEWNDIFYAYEKLTRHSLDQESKMKVAISSIFKTELKKQKAFYLFNPGSNCCEYKRDSIVIKPNGDVVPCTAFDNLIFGNISNQALERIWYSNLTQSFKTLPVSATECKDCEISGLCGAGCRKVAWELNKNILAKDDNACPLYKFAQEIIIPIMEEYGIKSQYLDKPKTYQYDLDIIKNAV